MVSFVMKTKTMSAPSKFIEFFGPSLWKSMHSIAYAAPESPSLEQQRDYIDFYKSLGQIIPCPNCRTHYNAHLKQHPIDASSRSALTKWVYDLHDAVNKRQGKVSPAPAVVDSYYSGWDNIKQMKHQAGGKRSEKALASPLIEDLNAEDERMNTVAASVVVCLLVAGAAVYWVKSREKCDCSSK